MDALVVIGGDSSLKEAIKLAEQGIQVMGVPASIYNDIFGTDICIWVDTTLNTIAYAIEKLRDTTSSHSRAFIVETMGRHCGYLAVLAGIVTGAEMVLVPEVQTPVETVVKAIDDAYRRGKTHRIIVVAEGFIPKASDLAQMIDDKDLGFTTRVTILWHIQRGGKPTAYDRLLLSRFGNKVVELLLAGQSNVMTGLNGRDIEPISLSIVTIKQRTLSMEYYQMASLLSQ